MIVWVSMTGLALLPAGVAIGAGAIPAPRNLRSCPRVHCLVVRSGLSTKANFGSPSCLSVVDCMLAIDMSTTLPGIALLGKRLDMVGLEKGHG